ncbi:MAG: ABC transporter permease [Deltaproteobacteria bacterium]|nr:ABC transporter permease [Deltaproteobacteria bacterium]
MVKTVTHLLLYLGGLGVLSLQTFSGIFRKRIDFPALICQIEQIGNKSFGLVALVAIFTSMVMALQLAVGLGRFGLKLYIGQIIGLTIVRELGPVLSCIMLAARVGSGIAAELGSMVVTEQVLAIEAMGANPVVKLVVPRVLACMIAAPLLSVMADIIGVFGAMTITIMETGVTSRFYLDQILKSVRMEDFVEGTAKTLFFGFFIAIISCYQGLNASGGTEGVGQATTRAVVYCAIVIFISDFFLTKLFLMI